MSDPKPSDDSTPQNPFDRLGLDPSLSRNELTEQLQRMAQRLTPEKRDEVRAIWRELTLKDSERVKLAFFAHPGSSEPIDTLRRQVPPTRTARPDHPDSSDSDLNADQPPFEATVFDALLEFGDSNAPTGLQIDENLQPDAGFLDIKSEGLAAAKSDANNAGDS